MSRAIVCLMLALSLCLPVHAAGPDDKKHDLFEKRPGWSFGVYQASQGCLSLLAKLRDTLPRAGDYGREAFYRTVWSVHDTTPSPYQPLTWVVMTGIAAGGYFTYHYFPSTDGHLYEQFAIASSDDSLKSATAVRELLGSNGPTRAKIQNLLYDRLMAKPLPPTHVQIETLELIAAIGAPGGALELKLLNDVVGEKEWSQGELTPYFLKALKAAGGAETLRHMDQRQEAWAPLRESDPAAFRALEVVLRNRKAQK